MEKKKTAEIKKVKVKPSVQQPAPSIKEVLYDLNSSVTKALSAYENIIVSLMARINELEGKKS